MEHKSGGNLDGDSLASREGVVARRGDAFRKKPKGPKGTISRSRHRFAMPKSEALLWYSSPAARWSSEVEVNLFDVKTARGTRARIPIQFRVRCSISWHISLRSVKHVIALAAHVVTIRPSFSTRSWNGTYTKCTCRLSNARSDFRSSAIFTRDSRYDRSNPTSRYNFCAIYICLVKGYVCLCKRISFSEYIYVPSKCITSLCQSVKLNHFGILPEIIARISGFNASLINRENNANISHELRQCGCKE